MSTKQKDVCEDGTLNSQEKWRKLVGTEMEGNLPQYKKNEHIGHCYAPCPYSTQAADIRTRHLLNLSTTDPLPVKVYHDTGGKEHFMINSYRGGWGYLCTYASCTYFINVGKQYFYK